MTGERLDTASTTLAMWSLKMLAIININWIHNVSIIYRRPHKSFTWLGCSISANRKQGKACLLYTEQSTCWLIGLSLSVTLLFLAAGLNSPCTCFCWFLVKVQQREGTGVRLEGSQETEAEIFLFALVLDGSNLLQVIRSPRVQTQCSPWNYEHKPDQDLLTLLFLQNSIDFLILLPSETS